MKRLGNVWSQVISIENLAEALRKAALGRKSRPPVQRILSNAPFYLAHLQKLLDTGRYYTSDYQYKTVNEPKERKISILPFYPDRIVHHALMNVLGPYWETMFIDDSYACRVGKGQHAGSLKCSEFVRQYKYVLKCDISKFYFSIPHAILKRIIAHKIKDRRVLKLLFEIIDSGNSCNTCKPGIGLPIGNLTSQWLGNLYLHELDMYVKQDLQVKGYIRYCDDFLLFSNDKMDLRRKANSVRFFVEKKLGLRLSKIELFPTAQGVDFLGYRHFRDYVLVRKRTARRIIRRLKKIEREGNFGSDRVAGQLGSAWGWMRWANSHNLTVAVKLQELKAMADNARKLRRKPCKAIQNI